MANIAKIALTSGLYKDERFGVTTKDHIRYGYQNPTRNAISYFLPKFNWTPAISYNFTSEQYYKMFPDGNNPTNGLVEFYIEVETDKRLNTDQYHDIGTIPGPFNPPLVESYNATIVLVLEGRNEYDEDGWQTIITNFGSFAKLHKSQVNHKRFVTDNNFDNNTLTEYRWQVLADTDFIEMFTTLDAADARNNVIADAELTPRDLLVTFIDEKISTSSTKIIRKDLTAEDKDDIALYNAPPKLANDLINNILPIGFDIEGTKILNSPYYSEKLDPTATERGVPNIGPKVVKATNCKVFGSMNKPMEASSVDSNFSVVGHIIGPSADHYPDFTSYVSHIVGKEVMSRDGTFRATITSVTGALDNNTGSLLDVDLNGEVDALTDGLMFLRYMFGLTGTSLVESAVQEGAQRTVEQMEDFLSDLTVRKVIDIDLDGNVDALTDGLLILRYMFGLRGEALVESAVAVAAQRSSPEAITAEITRLVNKLVQLDSNNQVVYDNSGNPITAAGRVLQYQVSLDSVRDTPSLSDDIYIELHEGEEINNITNVIDQLKESSSFKIYKQEEVGSHHWISHIITQDLARPNSWLRNNVDFYDKPMVLIVPQGPGAYFADLSLLTTSDGRISRQVTYPITNISDNKIFINNPSVQERLLPRQNVVLINNGIGGPLSGEYTISAVSNEVNPPGYNNASDSTLTDSILIDTSSNDPALFPNGTGIGDFRGPYDDITLYQIGKGSYIQPDKRTSVQVQGIAAPTTTVTLSNTSTDHTVNERISATVDLLPYGESLLVKYDKNVSIPPYIGYEILASSRPNLLPKSPRTADDEVDFVEGNCITNYLGSGKMVLVTPKMGGSRYRHTFNKNYFNGSGISSKIFQVEGNVRGVPVENIAPLTEGPYVIHNGGTINHSETLLGTDGIRLIFKIDTDLVDPTQISNIRGRLNSVTVNSVTGGTMATTTGPIKIPKVKEPDPNLFKSHTWFLDGTGDSNGVSQHEKDRIRTKTLPFGFTITQEDIDNNYIKVYVDGVLDSRWQRLSDTEIILDTEVGTDYFTEASDYNGQIGTYNYQMGQVVITSTADLMEGAIGLNTATIYHDSCVFIPDGSAVYPSQWSVNLTLNVSIEGISKSFTQIWIGTYRPEYGIDVLDPNGETRINSNTKPLRFTSSSTGTQIADHLDKFGNPAMGLNQPNATYFGNTLITYPFTVSEEDVYVWKQTTTASRSNYNGTVTVEIYYGGNIIATYTYSGASYDESSNRTFTDNATGATYFRDRYPNGETSATSGDIFTNVLRYGYKRQHGGSYKQPVTYSTDQYLEVNDFMSGNEDAFVVINNEPESMVGLQTDASNNRYKIVPTDWTPSSRGIGMDDNYGRQDNHLNHKYAFQVLRIK